MRCTLTPPWPLGTASAASPGPGQPSVQGNGVRARRALHCTIVAACGLSGFRPPARGRSARLPRRGRSSLKIFEGDGEIIPEQADVEPAPFTAEPGQVAPGDPDDDAILVLEHATVLGAPNGARHLRRR